MGALLVLCSLAASAPKDVEKATVIALPALRAFNLDPKLTAVFAEHLGTQLKLQGLQVMTSRELETLLGIERQRQLLGCSDDAGCMTEIVEALGADGVVVGDLARIGTTYQANLKIIAGNNGRTLAAFTESATSEDAMLEVLAKAARELAEPTFRNLGRAPPSNLSIVAGPPNLRKVAWAPLAVGALLVGAGIAGLVMSNNSYQALRSGVPMTEAEGLARIRAGQNEELLGVAGLISGGVAVAVGAVFLFFGPRAPVTPIVALSPHGGGFALSGSLP